MVNYHVTHLIQKAINSLYEHLAPLEMEIIVVDNSADLGEDPFLPNLFPKVRYFPQKENLGFARGMNLALNAAQGNILLLLNPDVLLEDNSLLKLWKKIKAEDSCIIYGPKLLNQDGSVQNGLRRFPTPFSALINHSLLRKLPLFKRYIDYSRMRLANLNQAQKVDQVSGAAMMFKREVLDRLGFLDERFFIYYEEVDYCKRAALAGIPVQYFPDAQIFHFGGKSAARVNKKMMVTRIESLLKYLKKHMSRPAWLLFIPVFKCFLYLSIFTESAVDLFLHGFHNFIKGLHAILPLSSDYPKSNYSNFKLRQVACQIRKASI